MRPLRVGEMLSRIWDLLRGDFAGYLKLGAPLVGAAFVVYACMFWAMFAAGLFPNPPAGTHPDPAKFWIFLASLLVVMPVMIVVYAIYQGAACSTALAALRGKRTTFAEAYRQGMHRAGSLIWMMILRMLAGLLPWIILGAVAGVFSAIGTMQGWSHPGVLFVLIPLVVLGYVVGIVWVIWIALHWSLSVPACMAEGLTGWQALKRSGRLSVGGKGRILGVFLLIGLIAMAAFVAVEMACLIVFGLGAAIGMTVHPGAATSYSPAGFFWHFGVWIVPFAVLLAAALYLLLALQWASYAVTMVVLYQDQRFRHEGSLLLPLGS